MDNNKVINLEKSDFDDETKESLCYIQKNAPKILEEIADHFNEIKGKILDGRHHREFYNGDEYCTHYDNIPKIMDLIKAWYCLSCECHTYPDYNAKLTEEECIKRNIIWRYSLNFMNEILYEFISKSNICSYKIYAENTENEYKVKRAIKHLIYVLLEVTYYQGIEDNPQDDNYIYPDYDELDIYYDNFYNKFTGCSYFNIDSIRYEIKPQFSKIIEDYLHKN